MLGTRELKVGKLGNRVRQVGVRGLAMGDGNQEAETELEAKQRADGLMGAIAQGQRDSENERK
jgi:hypothetical protein